MTSEGSILQVLISDLTKDWPAQKTWNLPQLVDKYGDVGFKVSQAHGKKIKMKLKDYAAYMACQHDEEPLYIFDAKVYDGLNHILSSLQVLSLSSRLHQEFCYSCRELIEMYRELKFSFGRSFFGQIWSVFRSTS